jgi:hypothetical protein
MWSSGHSPATLKIAIARMPKIKNGWKTKNVFAVFIVGQFILRLRCCDELDTSNACNTPQPCMCDDWRQDLPRRCVSTISCFDRLKEVWIYPFPNLPRAVDHHDVPRGVCDPKHSYLFSWGGRHSNYAEASPFASRLQIGDTKWTDLSWSSNSAWQANMASAAAAVSSIDHRYVVVIGGLDYRPKFTLLNTVVIRDLCRDRVCISPQRLARARGAVCGCRHQDENKALVCGGVSVQSKRFRGAMHNDPTCELVDIDELLAHCNNENKWIDNDNDLTAKDN